MSETKEVKILGHEESSTDIFRGQQKKQTNKSRGRHVCFISQGRLWTLGEGQTKCLRSENTHWAEEGQGRRWSKIACRPPSKTPAWKCFVTGKCRWLRFEWVKPGPRRWSFLPSGGDENVQHRNPYKGCWRSGNFSVLEYFLLVRAIRRTPGCKRLCR